MVTETVIMEIKLFSYTYTLKLRSLLRCLTAFSWSSSHSATTQPIQPITRHSPNQYTSVEIIYGIEQCINLLSLFNLVFLAAVTFKECAPKCTEEFVEMTSNVIIQRKKLLSLMFPWIYIFV